MNHETRCTLDLLEEIRDELKDMNKKLDTWIAEDKRQHKDKMKRWEGKKSAYK